MPPVAIEVNHDDAKGTTRCFVGHGPFDASTFVRQEGLRQEGLVNIEVVAAGHVERIGLGFAWLVVVPGVGVVAPNGVADQVFPWLHSHSVAARLVCHAPPIVKVCSLNRIVERQIKRSIGYGSCCAPIGEDTAEAVAALQVAHQRIISCIQVSCLCQSQDLLARVGVVVILRWVGVAVGSGEGVSAPWIPIELHLVRTMPEPVRDGVASACVSFQRQTGVVVVVSIEALLVELNRDIGIGNRIACVGITQRADQLGDGFKRGVYARIHPRIK